MAVQKFKINIDFFFLFGNPNIRGGGVKPVGPNSQLLPKICFEGFPQCRTTPIPDSLNGCKVPQVMFHNVLGCDIAHWTLSTQKNSPSCEFQPVVISPLAETKFNSCCGRSQQNEPWNLLYLSRLVDSVILIYVNPQTFSKISFSQSLAETSIEEKYGPQVSEFFFHALFTNDIYYG